jgi:hypothetical protein
MGMWIYKIIAFSIGVGCASSENSSPPFAHAGATPFASREGMGRGFLPKDPSPVQGRDRCRLLHTEEWSLRYDRAQWKSPFRPSENQSFTSIILFSGAFRKGDPPFTTLVNRIKVFAELQIVVVPYSPVHEADQGASLPFPAPCQNCSPGSRRGSGLRGHYPVRSQTLYCIVPVVL